MGSEAESDPMAGRTGKRSSISVVMAVFNERRTIREIVRRVKAVDREKEIVVVDDGSVDGTRGILGEFASDPELRIFFQPHNKGKGAALQRGFQAATKDVVIVQDADLEYSPADYEALLRPFDAGLADVVYGSRFLHGERRVLYFRHTLGNRFLTLLSNLFTDLNLTDMETCYKAFKREIIQNIRLSSKRFGFEPEITAKLAKLDCTIYEVPINYYGRSYSQGKKITWRDGIAALRHIIVYSLSGRPFVIDQEAIDHALVSPPDPPDTGILTLEVFEKAVRYNRWIFSRLEPYVGERVLEVGSGIGNIVAELVNHRGVKEIVATDPSEEGIKTIHDRFGPISNVSTVLWDASGDIPSALSAKCFDTVVCSNVLEHIEDDARALANMRRMLSGNGRLLLLVPAHQWLFCPIDEDLGHFRRYGRKPLRRLLENSGFEVEHLIPHNSLGILGWLVKGKLLRYRYLSNRDIRRFDALVPLVRKVDPVMAPLFGGVSLIAVCKPRQD